MNPYEKCPVYETKHFILRMVTMEDAQDLLCCYSDRKAVVRMNADNCGTDFYFAAPDEMKAYIAIWLQEYTQGAYVRFAVVDRETGRAIGTAEIFGGERGGCGLTCAMPMRQRKRSENCCGWQRCGLRPIFRPGG